MFHGQNPLGFVFRSMFAAKTYFFPFNGAIVTVKFSKTVLCAHKLRKEGKGKMQCTYPLKRKEL